MLGVASTRGDLARVRLRHGSGAVAGLQVCERVGDAEGLRWGMGVSNETELPALSDLVLIDYP